MDNTHIAYKDFVKLAYEHCGDVDILGETISRMGERLALDYDQRIMALIEKRLGGLPVDMATLKGRLTRVITRGAGYETLLLDGRPFARVYEATVTTNELKTTVKQVIEELEG